VAGGRVLWVLRHAKTHRDPPAGGDDHDRTLAPRGRRDADALGKRLGDDGDHLGLPEDVMPGLVLCSTAIRAIQTTERALAGLAEPPRVVYQASLYGAGPEEVLEEVSKVDHTVGSVMVVGHNPTFEALVGAVAESPPSSLTGGFATCGLAVFEIPVPEWAEIAPHTAAVLGVFVPPF
jgi:phosphohistidine phosphatase